MEIDSNMNLGPVNGLPASRRATAATPQPGAAPTDTFTSSAALQNSQVAPDVRSEAVARGLALVANPGYPDSQTVKQLSSFLASRITGTGGQ